MRRIGRLGLLSLTIIFIILSNSLAAYRINPFTGKLDYYEAGVANSATNPSAYYYFSANTYFYFDGTDVWLYINYTPEAGTTYIVYNGRNLIYGGRILVK